MSIVVINSVVYHTSIVMSLHTEYLMDNAALHACSRYGCESCAMRGMQVEVRKVYSVCRRAQTTG